MEYRVKRRGTGSLEEIVADLKRVAAIRGDSTVTQNAYEREGEFSINWVVKVCGSWNGALAKAGCTLTQRTWTRDDCIKGIKLAYDKLGRQPYYSDYKILASQLGLPRISTVESRLGSWTKALGMFKASAHSKDNSGKDLRMSSVPAASRYYPPRKTHGCGEPSGFERMIYAPINELGVLALFSMLAGELGFIIECVGAAFPDCTAKRRDPKTGRHVPVLIELEYRSSSFKKHNHPTDGCNLIVCWEHDWAACPESIEVLSLKSYLKDRKLMQKGEKAPSF